MTRQRPRASAFDADTALEPIAERRWHAVVPASWSIGAGVNGGFFAALATRAAGLASGVTPRSVTIHYLAAPAEEAVEATATILRRGRTTTFLRLDFAQHGEVVAQALAVCAPWQEGRPEFFDAEPPGVPPREACTRVDPSAGSAPPLLANYEMLVAADPERRPVDVSGWVRTAQPRHSDEILLAAMTDAFLPPAFVRHGPDIAVPTLELTIHFRGLPPAGEHPWIVAAFTSRVAAGGLVEEDGELWSEDGVLLAQSRQISMIREVRRT